MWISRVLIFTSTFIALQYCMQANATRWPAGKDNSFATKFNVLESENGTTAAAAANGVNWMQLYWRRFANGQPDTNVGATTNNENTADEPFSYDSRIGLFLFTRYCGPGSRIWKKFFPNGDRSYSDVDQCCKMHDECPNFVEKEEHYNQYPGLEIRPQFFSRLQCKCDSDFYKCLDRLNSTYAYSVGVGYSVFQRNCLELEHPIEGCLEYYSLYGMQRCEVYQVDHRLPKKWQWFDVLPPFAPYKEFPQIALPNN